MLDPTCRLTKAVDIFTLGCLFYFIATLRHPYGDTLERQSNILKGKYHAANCDRTNVHNGDFHALFSAINAPDPAQRLPIEDVLRHPLFWDAAKHVAFLEKASEALSSRELFVVAKHFDKSGICCQWDRELDPVIVQNIVKFRIYDFSKAVDLLRVVRNQAVHFLSLTPEEQLPYGSFPDGFLAYYTVRFPTLFTVVFNLLRPHVRDNPLFAEFFVVDLN